VSAIPHGCQAHPQGSEPASARSARRRPSFPATAKRGSSISPSSRPVKRKEDRAARPVMPFAAPGATDGERQLLQTTAARQDRHAAAAIFSGTFRSCQIAEVLGKLAIDAPGAARRRSASRILSLNVSPAVVRRSTGINSVSTKRPQPRFEDAQLLPATRNHRLPLLTAFSNTLGIPATARARRPQPFRSDAPSVG